jgi:L-fuconolactonase
MATNSQSARVDAHQHFWHYTPDEFGWIDDSMAAVRLDFLPSDLRPLMDQAKMSATVAVQARQSIEETRWLLDLADRHPWIAGVVGWLPIADPSIEHTLEEFADNPRLKGVRHVLQGEPDAYMDRDGFNAGIAPLRQHSLTYDVLILERQLPAAIRFVDRHPDQPFVLDHLAKPSIAAHQVEPWRTHLRELARRPNVSCKLSGMVTEADFSAWTIEDLRPYIETALEAFGPSRLLFGSDWPVCTAASTYDHWVTIVHELVSALSEEERNAIFGDNAAKFYNLSIHHEVRPA